MAKRQDLLDNYAFQPQRAMLISTKVVHKLAAIYLYPEVMVLNALYLPVELKIENSLESAPG